MQSAIDFYHQYIDPTDRLIVAVSGGVDSVVLLHLVASVHPREHIIIVHVDHQIRGESAQRDASFVESLSREYAVQYDHISIDVPALARDSRMSIEAAGRQARYDFFENIRNQHNAKYILTAHHLDDRIETMLLHLIRGTRLGGIHALIAHQAHLLRPLISMTKYEIMQYALSHDLEYREDETNADIQYLRNRIRHDIVPVFESINSEYRRSIEGFIDYTSDLKDYIDEQITGWFGAETMSFLVSAFAAESVFFQREIIRSIYERAHDGTIGLSEGLVEELRRYILTAEGSTEKHIGRLQLSKKQQRVGIAILEK